MKPLLPRLSLAALLLLLASCAKQSDTSSTSSSSSSSSIKVGEYASLTGKDASFGQSSHKGAVMAFEEVNAAGGVLGKKIELLTEDNQTKAGESATAAKKLINRDKVIALLGEVASGRSLEVAPIAQEVKIPMISPAATNPKVTETGDYVFRVCFIDPFQGTVMAKFALTDLKAKRVAIISSVSNAFSVGLAKFFHETYTQGGGTVVVEPKYTEGDKDFRAQLTAVKAAGVDAVFLPGYYTESALLIRQARDLGLTVPFLGGDGWESAKLIEIGGDALNGCYYSTHFSPQNKDANVTQFVERFKKRWSNETPDAFAALGYDAALVLADSIKRAGNTTGPALRDAIAATKGFAGATGITTINKERNASKGATIIALKNGQFVFHKIVAP